VLDRLRRDPCTMSKLGSDLDKSLEELEGTQWPAPTHDPRLVHGLFPSEKLTTPLLRTTMRGAGISVLN